MMFKPSILSSVLMLIAVLVFCRLGGCQLDRAERKDTRLIEFASAPQLVELPGSAMAAEFAHLTLKGQFRMGKDVLADNQVLNGQSGVHVYTVFETESGKNILVNRGWLPMSLSRSPLPLVKTPAGLIEIMGRIGPIPVTGRELGKDIEMSMEHWPQLQTYPKIGKISAALQLDLYHWVLFLDENSPGGFSGRQWKPVFMSPERHRAYAFQWFAMAMAALAGWIFIAYQRGAKA
ncbi:MAG: surfeit locus 1 family protein [Rhodothermales bacterium]|jgi:surfeit locus 1 family protein